RLTPALVRVSTTHPSSTSVRPFFLHDPAPTETYTLSLHDALPICSTAHTGPYSRRPNPAEIRQLTRQRIPAHPGARPPQLTACFTCPGFQLGLMDLDVIDALQCP